LTQSAVSIAIQLQPVPVSTVKLLDPPLVLKFWPGGLKKNGHPDDWKTVKVCKAIVIVPLRSEPVLV
jgi:hypothetical protein